MIMNIAVYCCYDSRLMEISTPTCACVYYVYIVDYLCRKVGYYICCIGDVFHEYGDDHANKHFFLEQTVSIPINYVQRCIAFQISFEKCHNINGINCKHQLGRPECC